MPKVSQLKTVDQIAAAELADPEIRREHDRTALAHAVAMRVIGYRIDHDLSQSGLARLLGMHQPTIARLEAGDHEPSLATLSRLARALGLEFHIDIAPEFFERATPHSLVQRSAAGNLLRDGSAAASVPPTRPDGRCAAVDGAAGPGRRARLTGFRRPAAPGA